ncbi:hypothetical protein GCM10023235_22850 [Kitasatospora terrestris]|uniref:Uncharacterized protein n=1 Tax=Kitasatospora terrestris TaxID=258051 RepID=A0ABP9DIF3_9ACTN
MSSSTFSPYLSQMPASKKTVIDVGLSSRYPVAGIFTAVGSGSPTAMPGVVGCGVGCEALADGAGDALADGLPGAGEDGALLLGDPLTLAPALDAEPPDPLPHAVNTPAASSAPAMTAARRRFEVVLCSSMVCVPPEGRAARCGGTARV